MKKYDSHVEAWRHQAHLEREKVRREREVEAERQRRERLAERRREAAKNRMREQVFIRAIVMMDAFREVLHSPPATFDRRAPIDLLSLKKAADRCALVAKLVAEMGVPALEHYEQHEAGLVQEAMMNARGSKRPW